MKRAEPQHAGDCQAFKRLGEPVTEFKNTDNRNDKKASLEKYLLMNEKEKDIEIQKAVARLQKRIQEILYFLDTDKPRPESTKKTDSLPRD